MPSRVSLAELIDSDVPLRPDEAVAILREVCRQYAAGDLHGIPNATVIRLTPEGGVAVEGPVSRDQDPVSAAAALLGELLPGFDTPTGFKVPGGLRLVVARATRTLDLPPFADVGEFCGALARFGAPDLGGAVRGLFRSWSARRAVSVEPHPHELTISDIRRARRATGLSLEDIARVAGIPAWRLRELEWGYLRNWRADEQGREDLRHYARAAGLDDGLVASVAWPLIQAAAADPAVTPAPVNVETAALIPAPVRALDAPLPWRPAPERARPPRAQRYRWALALASGLLLVAAAFVMGWDRPETTLASTELPVAAREAPSTADSPLDRSTADRVMPVRSMDPARPASYVRPAAARPRAAKSKPRQPEHKSFFKRELFRIVIR